ncbi:oxidoreductase [Pseudoclavibacter endophyticus]|uniref:Alpha/beta fold hydrolase n=1 Tax=Pseudoclavibacter endophyticus TaxID=1778590 RepID=A0A6H9WRR5_9MICO|nr:alpha/beta fold hydrolase [Pseudoclavibacter endophyticus]KAB1649465.1 alpha/beta fold hydrolase [Pseudoclavibacter endophyticus]GGA62434.1 oxidoreductase [Pseudoclavibacter endophyticus]
MEREPGNVHTSQLDRRFAWRGRSVAWTSRGDGPPLVLLHGTPWSQQLWAPVAAVLADRFTVYQWDMPGYGASSKAPDDAVDLGVQGELFAELLSAWGLARPHVIAHDYGGAVALRARLLHGARFASLALVDVVALAPWGSPFFQLVRENSAVFEQLPPAIHRATVEAYIRGASHRGLDDASLSMLVHPWIEPGGQAAFYRQIAAADERFTNEVESGYASIDEPVHLVWGAEDTWIPVDRAHRLRAMIPGSTLAVIPEAGHLIHLDAPTGLAAELVRWTERHRDVPAGTPVS